MVSYLSVLRVLVTAIIVVLVTDVHILFRTAIVILGNTTIYQYGIQSTERHTCLLTLAELAKQLDNTVVPPNQSHLYLYIQTCSVTIRARAKGG